MILVLLLSISLLMTYFIGVRQKDVYSYLMVSMTSYIFTFGVMCVGFLLLKFNGTAELIFPDEMLYANDMTSKLSFAYYVRFFKTYFDLDIVRWINITLFTISLAVLSSEIVSRLHNKMKQLTIVLAMFGAIVGGYWSFFILKEAFSVAALSMLIVAYIRRSNSIFLLSALMLIFARPELLILYIGVNIVFLIKRKIPLLFYIGVIGLAFIFILFMNSEHSYSIKLFTLSRRFGEAEFSFDNVAGATSHLPFFSFIMSEPFRQAIITNFNSTFNPLADFNPLVIFQRIFNIIGFILFLFILRKNLMKDKLYTFVFIILIGVLCTHSVYRYFNTILVPFILYFIYLKVSFYNSEVLSDKSISDHSRL